MKKTGKFLAAEQKRSDKKRVLLSAVLLIAAVVGIALFLQKNNEEQIQFKDKRNTPYSITSTLMANDVQWAQATLWKETPVHLYLTQKQINDIVGAVSNLQEADFEEASVKNAMSVMFYFGKKEVLLHYDGKRVGIIFDSITSGTTEPGKWSVERPELKALLDPIFQLDNTKKWVSYMTTYDLDNLRTNAETVTWEFFEDFAYWNIGTDQLMIPVEDTYYVLAEGDLEGRPASLQLVEFGNTQKRVNLRTGDVSAFMNEAQKPAQNQQPAVAGFYSQEQAMIDGCVVMEDGDVRHNQKNWRSFLDKAALREDASITVMHYERKEYGTVSTRYDITFDGEIYTVNIATDEMQFNCVFTNLEMSTGDVYSLTDEYDSFIRYTLTGGRDTADVVIYEDQIANPDFTGIEGAALHLKEGEAPLLSFDAEEDVSAIIKLMKDAEYLAVPPEDYIFGVKLMFYTKTEMEFFLEIDILQGIFRYGNQYYEYGKVSDLFEVLDIEKWPREVREEYASYLTG